MVKPDVELTSAIGGKIFYNGRIFDIAKSKRGWEVFHMAKEVAVTATVEKACAFLAEQKEQTK